MHRFFTQHTQTQWAEATCLFLMEIALEKKKIATSWICPCGMTVMLIYFVGGSRTSAYQILAPLVSSGGMVGDEMFLIFNGTSVDSCCKACKK